MAARAIWKGSLELGSAAIPVKLYSAAVDRTVHFHLLERRTHERIKQRMVNPESGIETERENIRKGYEIRKDTFVVLSDKELESIEPKASTSIDVPKFLPENKIGSQFYDRPYFLTPDGDSKSYFALAQALARKRREGLAHWVMRKKEYTGLLSVYEGYLVLTTLRYGEDVFAAKDLRPAAGKAASARELEMAEQLISALEGEFRPEDFKDEYRARVLDYIEAKGKGRKPKLQTIRRKAATTALADDLAASLKAVRKKAGKEKAVA